MSLYDDVVTDFGATNKAENQTNDIANWSNNSLKLLKYQVETAKKRQQISLNAAAAASSVKRDKLSTTIAPVIDLSEKRKPQMQLAKEMDTYVSPLSLLKPLSPITNNKLTGKKIERDDDDYNFSIYGGSIVDEYDPMKPNDYEKLINELKISEKAKTLASKSSNGDRNDKRRSSDDNKRRSVERDRKHRRRSRSSSSSSSSRDRSSKDKKHKNKHKRSRSRSRDRSSRSRRSDSRDRDRDRRRDDNKRRSRHSSSSEDERNGHKRKHDDRNDNYNSKRAYHNNEENNNSKRSSAAFAPPPSLIEIDQKISNNNNNETHSNEDKQAAPTKTLFGGLLKAEKMMAKMGYKEGEGLGRNKQGMSIALQVEKTGKRSGRIIHEKDVVEPPVIPTPPVLLAPPAVKEQPPAVGISNEVMKNMSKVILLRNMVAPGDVDDELEGETKEECQKYGEVNKVIIFEMPNKPPDEAVRIFIEFKTLPSAIKALTDLNGRFFGGRIVKAIFYNLDKFKRLELADEV